MGEDLEQILIDCLEKFDTVRVESLKEVMYDIDTDGKFLVNINFFDGPQARLRAVKSPEYEIIERNTHRIIEKPEIPEGNINYVGVCKDSENQKVFYCDIWLEDGKLKIYEGDEKFGITDRACDVSPPLLTHYTLEDG
ncbi:MAG: hypothetical protein KAS04_03615, partial [Candidatus Aenigmarchaeota archaeon]|nr:hypothetical protein [Candidatus Aenigmarchaeota archaeon]